MSNKSDLLIKMYKHMAKYGYKKRNGQIVPSKKTFSNFELLHFKDDVNNVMSMFDIKTVLDYGSGDSNWEKYTIFDGLSAVDFFGLDNAYLYEPARNIDQRQKVDCVISFDVLEHVFISDIPTVLDDIFSYAKKLVILNVAGYKATALLPNGENAHITIRSKFWWKGMLDYYAIKHPDIAIKLIYSNSYKNSNYGPLWKGRLWLEGDTLETK